MEKFKIYHQLIKELVEPDEPGQPKMLDRQVAIIFELRRIPEYFEASLGILKGLRPTWGENLKHKRLLDEYTDAQVARILNERGLRTGAGDAFDTVSVQWVRYTAKLKSLKERLLQIGMITKRQLCARLGVSRTTISKLRTQERLKARICNDRGEWLYWPPEEVPPDSPSSTESIKPSVTSTAGDAV